MALLTGKTAIITGGAQGIGKAIAEKYLAEEAQVAIVDINCSLAEETARELEGRYQKKCRAFYADITKEEDIQKAVQEILGEFSRIDILVNNAGIQPRSLPFWEIPTKDWDKVMELDLRSVYLFSKVLAPYFIERKSGTIVNTSSVSGLYLWNQCVHYITAKAAIIDMTRAMAYELMDYGIRVNAVAPGHVDTELNAKSLQEPGGRKNREDQVALGKIALPKDLAGAFAYAASDYAGQVTGTVIYVDGGLTQLK